MNAVKELLFQNIRSQKAQMLAMADYICDHPEVGLQEYQACSLLSDYLRTHGFEVETGVGGLETAFRGEYVCGSGDGPSIGLLCEYDALEGIGHGCAHHLQGPCIVGTAVALKEVLGDRWPGRIIVYGTPAEETVGGKIIMQKNGCFEDIDVAFMMHGSGAGTRVDTKSMALTSYTVKFHGRNAHAAIHPEEGRSALDAMLLSFQGIEFLREHVRDDVRIHYTILDGGGPANAVPESAAAQYILRFYSRDYLNEILLRFQKILQGAALMTETEYDLSTESELDSKIPVLKLNDLLMENARLVGAPNIQPPRERTGSTDFGNIMYRVPGSCIRVECDGGAAVPSHSREAVALGKCQSAHEAILYGSEILAASAYDLLSNPLLLREIQEEFQRNKVECR